MLLLFYSHSNFFNILLVFVFFQQSCYDAGLFGTAFLHLFHFQTILYICFLLFLLIILYYFHNSLCSIKYHVSISFIISCSTHFLYVKKLQCSLFIDQIRIMHYACCIIFDHIPKINSVIITFDRDNSNIIKTHSFLH